MKQPRVVAVVALFGAYACSPGDVADESVPRSLAVLPLLNVSADPEESDYLAQGISRAVITKLTQTGLRVTPWDTARRYQGSDSRAEDIALELNVDAVLVGTFELVEDQILTTLSLVEVETGLQSWTDELQAPYENVFEVQRRIAAGAAASVNRELSGEEADVLAEPESQSVEAYDYYLQGTHLMQETTREATAIALEYFNRALDIDSALAEAHVGVGAAEASSFFYGWEGPAALARAEKAYTEALRLSPGSMPARRGLIAVYFYGGQSEACLIQGQEAARLGWPDEVETLLAKGMGYLFGGLQDRAIPILERAVEIDPANQGARFHLTDALFVSGQYERAIEAGEDYIERYGKDPDLFQMVARAWLFLGEPKRALAVYDELGELPEGFEFLLSDIGLMRARSGDREGAEEAWRLAVERLEARVQAQPEAFNVHIDLAVAQGHRGNRTAFEAHAHQALKTDVNIWILPELAPFYAKFGRADEAVAILRRTFEAGGVHPMWEVSFRAFDVPYPETPAFESFQRGFLKERARLREAY